VTDPALLAPTLVVQAGANLLPVSESEMSAEKAAELKIDVMRTIEKKQHRPIGNKCMSTSTIARLLSIQTALI
jgi:hypothetical protein